MKYFVAFVAVIAVASAQFGQPNQNRYYPRPQVSVSTLRPPVPSPIGISRPSNSDQTANIVRYDSDISPDGSYSYGFETDNGIGAQAQGTPRDFGGNPPVIPVVSQGSFSWTSPEGVPIVISYIADENGYQPQGDAIPTSPPIPEAILRSLEYNARNPGPQKK